MANSALSRGRLGYIPPLPRRKEDPLTVVDELADETILVTDNLPKSKPAYLSLKTIIGKDSLVAIEGDHWKRLRKMFNPAFAPSHLETLIPCIVQESEVFVDKLYQVSKSTDIVEMNRLTTVYSLPLALFKQRI
jgi:cytochrome P450